MLGSSRVLLGGFQKQGQILGFQEQLPNQPLFIASVTSLVPARWKPLAALSSVHC